MLSSACRLLSCFTTGCGRPGSAGAAAGTGGAAAAGAAAVAVAVAVSRIASTARGTRATRDRFTVMLALLLLRAWERRRGPPCSAIVLLLSRPHKKILLCCCLEMQTPLLGPVGLAGLGEMAADRRAGYATHMRAAQRFHSAVKESGWQSIAAAGSRAAATGTGRGGARPRQPLRAQHSFKSHAQERAGERCGTRRGPCPLAFAAAATAGCGNSAAGRARGQGKRRRPAARLNLRPPRSCVHTHNTHNALTRTPARARMPRPLFDRIPRPRADPKSIFAATVS